MCPMCDGPKPHVGGPVTGPGAPNVLINGKPAALMGDMCTCVGPPDMIAQGAPSVMINGTPVACQNDMTAHGGMISQGESTVIVGTAQPAPSATMAANKIPFPDISTTDRVKASISGNGQSLEEAEENQQTLKEQAEDEEGEPRIYNLQWVKQERIVRESKVVKKVTLRADVQNIGDGSSVTVNVQKPAPEGEDSKEKKAEQVVELTGTVKDKQVEVEWEIEDPTDKNKSNKQ